MAVGSLMTRGERFLARALEESPEAAEQIAAMAGSNHWIRDVLPGTYPSNRRTSTEIRVLEEEAASVYERIFAEMNRPNPPGTISPQTFYNSERAAQYDAAFVSYDPPEPGSPLRGLPGRDSSEQLGARAKVIGMVAAIKRLAGSDETHIERHAEEPFTEHSPMPTLVYTVAGQRVSQEEYESADAICHERAEYRLSPLLPGELLTEIGLNPDLRPHVVHPTQDRAAYREYRKACVR